MVSLIEIPRFRIRKDAPDVWTVYELVDEPEPEITPPINLINQLQWNDDSPWPFVARSLNSVTTLTIHHSGSTDREHTSIENWNAYHTRTKRWPHIGYHCGIGFYDGVMGLYQFNPLDLITWHDSKNTRSVGLVIAGDLRAGEDERPTVEQAELFGRFVAWLVPQLPNLRYIVGHKHVQRTACPGQIDVYGSALTSAANEYGIDVSEMWMVRPPALARFVSRFRRREGPPLEAYEDV